jgi:two-component system sensor histidine kinase ChvG
MRGALGRAAEFLRPTRIGVRLLLFNLLVLFLPVAGVLYLNVYEQQLLATQERGMVQQARIVAAAFGSAPLADAAPLMIERLAVRTEARVRVYDARATLLADSARVPVPQLVEPYPPADADAGRQRLVYRLGAWIVRVRRSLARAMLGHPAPASPASREDVPREVRAALEGRFGADTRSTPAQRSLTMNTAVPIRQGTAVAGAVVVSQSTSRILQALYRVRVRIFEVVLASVALAAILTVLASATVVRPVARLRAEASALATRRTKLPGAFVSVDRRDELGDLARALDDLARRLDAHIRLLEAFAADVAHEFKNPLASIRTAAEMAANADDAKDRERFLDLLSRDVDRLERLVTGVRELARLDTQLAHEAPARVDVAGLVRQVVDDLRVMGDARVRLEVAPGAPSAVAASRDALTQVFENILLNARSFSPPDQPIDVVIDRAGDRCRVTVTDRGPGIPEGHLSRVFDRFFTYRPDEPGRRDHAGVGLAIARTIVEGYGGTISASNREGGGAVFEVALPAAKT